MYYKVNLLAGLDECGNYDFAGGRGSRRFGGVGRRSLVVGKSFTGPFDVAQGRLRCTEQLANHFVLAFYQTARVGLGRYMTQLDIVWQAAKEWDAFSDAHGYAGDDEPLDQAGAEESLNGDAAIDVEVMSAAGGEFRNDFGRSSGHLFDDASADF